jgi:hypothetical protein
VKNLFASPPQGPVAASALPSTPGPAARLAQQLPAAAPSRAPEPEAAAPAGESTSVPETPIVPVPAPKLTVPSIPSVAPKGNPPKERQKRVVAIKGATLVGQDGTKVLFRKKCLTCGFEEPARSSAFIKIGTSRVPFFCPKCRRGRAVEITAVI